MSKPVRKLGIGDAIVILERRRAFLAERVAGMLTQGQPISYDRREMKALEIGISCCEQVWERERSCPQPCERVTARASGSYSIASTPPTSSPRSVG
jgi:hypothetical protein